MTRAHLRLGLLQAPNTPSFVKLTMAPSKPTNTPTNPSMAPSMDPLASATSRRLYNLLNCLLLTEDAPCTPARLREAYLEVEGEEVAHAALGFPSLLHLLAAWFPRGWWAGGVVLVPRVTDRVEHLVPRARRERWARVEPVQGWVGSLLLTSASTVLGLVGGEVEELRGLGLPVTLLHRLETSAKH